MDVKLPFNDEQICLEYLEDIRWTGFVQSPFSKNSKVYACKLNRYRCRDTGKYFNARTKTIFHNSKIPLYKWFSAIVILRENPELTSADLGARLGITSKSAWLLLRRLKRLGVLDGFTNTTTSQQNDLDKLNLTQWLTLFK